MTLKNVDNFVNFCAARASKVLPPVTIPFEVISQTKWHVLVTPALQQKLPRVELDKLEIRRNEQTGGYWLALFKNGKVHEMAIRDFPELTEYEMAEIVLFAG